MITPLGAPSVAEAVSAGSEVYAALKKRLAARGFVTSVGDEGGFAPDIARPEDVLTEIVASIGDAGYTAGREQVAIALDPAASGFYRDGGYMLAREKLTSDDMIARYARPSTSSSGETSRTALWRRRCRCRRPRRRGD